MSIKAILNKAKRNSTLVSIYVDRENWDQFSLGYVDAITDKHVRLRSLSRYGELSGYEIRPLDEIFKVEMGGKYENKIEKLRSNQEKIFAELELPTKVDVDLILDTLKASMETQSCIVVWGDDPDESLVGIVETLDSESVTLHLIDEFGASDGKATVHVKEITSLDFNTQAEQVRKFLYKAGFDKQGVGRVRRKP